MPSSCRRSSRCTHKLAPRRTPLLFTALLLVAPGTQAETRKAWDAWQLARRMVAVHVDDVRVPVPPRTPPPVPSLPAEAAPDRPKAAGRNPGRLGRWLGMRSRSPELEPAPGPLASMGAALRHLSPIKRRSQERVPAGESGGEHAAAPGDGRRRRSSSLLQRLSSPRGSRRSATPSEGALAEPDEDLVALANAHLRARLEEKDRRLEDMIRTATLLQAHRQVLEEKLRKAEDSVTAYRLREANMVPLSRHMT